MTTQSVNIVVVAFLLAHLLSLLSIVEYVDFLVYMYVIEPLMTNVLKIKI